MKAAVTLKKNYEFRRVYSKGKSGVSPFLVVYARANHSGKNRMGVTVSTKLGGAVVRNRIRRRLRELYRLSLPRLRRGYDVVLVGRSRALRAGGEEMRRAFLRCCAAAGLLEAEE